MECLFIECVKNHPCLWKTDTEEYSINSLKDEAWRKVIAESAVSQNDIKTVKAAKYFWKKLRDIHRQTVSRQRKDMGIKKWKHQDQMAFLLPYLKRPNESKNSTADSDILRDDTKIDDTASGSTTPKQPRKTENIFINEYCKEDSDSNTLGRNQAFDGTQVVDVTFSQRPALASFFASMCEMTSTLPELIQMRVERKIFDVVMEAREEYLQNQAFFDS